LKRQRSVSRKLDRLVRSNFLLIRIGWQGELCLTFRVARLRNCQTAEPIVASLGLHMQRAVYTPSKMKEARI
jgi:hypothetical protein